MCVVFSEEFLSHNLRKYNSRVLKHNVNKFHGHPFCKRKKEGTAKKKCIDPRFLVLIKDAEVKNAESDLQDYQEVLEKTNEGKGQS